MVLLFFTLDEHVIHVYFYFPPNLLAEHLVRSFCVLEAERHDSVAIEPLVGDEGGLLLILFCHLYLVVSEEGVNKSKGSYPLGMRYLSPRSRGTFSTSRLPF